MDAREPEAEARSASTVIRPREAIETPHRVIRDQLSTCGVAGSTREVMRLAAPLVAAAGLQAASQVSVGTVILGDTVRVSIGADLAHQAKSSQPTLAELAGMSNALRDDSGRWDARVQDGESVVWFELATQRGKWRRFLETRRLLALIDGTDATKLGTTQAQTP